MRYKRLEASPWLLSM